MEPWMLRRQARPILAALAQRGYDVSEERTRCWCCPPAAIELGRATDTHVVLVTPDALYLYNAVGLRALLSALPTWRDDQSLHTRLRAGGCGYRVAPLP